MTEEKKKKILKTLVIFHRANKTDNYKRGRKKEEKIQKNLQNKSKH